MGKANCPESIVKVMPVVRVVGSSWLQQTAVLHRPVPVKEMSRLISTDVCHCAAVDLESLKALWHYGSQVVNALGCENART